MGLITRPTKSTGGTSYTDGTIPNASDFNGDMDVLFNEINGNLDNANIKVGAAIDGSKIAPFFTTSVKLTNNTFLQARNAANTDDINIILVDTLDEIIISPGGVKTYLNSIVDCSGLFSALDGIAGLNDLLVIKNDLGDILFAFDMNIVGGIDGLAFTVGTSGQRPVISCFGTSTNIGLSIVPKGSGVVHILGPTTIGDVIARNGIVIIDAVDTLSPSINAQGISADIDIIMTTKGTGRFKLTGGMTMTGSLIIGSGLLANNIITTSQLWDPPAISSGLGASLNVTVTGAALTDHAWVTTNDASMSAVANVKLSARVVSANTVMITWQNFSGVSVNPGSATYFITVLKRT